jgi:hypothetical protein
MKYLWRSDSKMHLGKKSLKNVNIIAYGKGSPSNADPGPGEPNQCGYASEPQTISQAKNLKDSDKKQ